MASSAEDIIETAALGRPFTLGMLYDCRKDFLVPGVTLWDNEDLRQNTCQKRQQNTEFNITASDSIDEKSNSLNVSGSLKLSLLGGLVNVSGSAKYFQDTKKSHKQQRLTLHYKTTTRYESLTMSHLGRGKVSHPNVFEDRTATHVVTAILYGASAYFMFDRESSNNEDKKHVEGEAKLMMDKLKFIKISAEASFDMDEREKSVVEKFSCTFHGDFHLTSNPSSFIEAMNVYRQLPKLLGENGEHAFPVRVWMYPLVKLDSTAAKLQREISNSLITYSSGVIEDFNETEMRCNDLLKDTAATTFSAMKEKLQTFMQNCRHYKVEFVQKLGSVLPSIRGGVQEERDLADILKAHEKSPFNSKYLDQWLTKKEKESETINSFLKQLEKLGAKLDDNLDGLLSDLDITNIVSFTFTSIDQPDSSLVKQSHFLSPAGMMNVCPESDTLQNRNTDWISADTRQKMRKQLQLFKHLKEQLDSSDDTKFIVSSKHDERYLGAFIFIYEEGSDKPVPFIPPSKPAPPTTSDVSSDRFTVGVSDPDSATVEFQVEFKRNQEAEWTSHSVEKKQKTVTLSGLKPDTKYEIRVTAVDPLSTPNYIDLMIQSEEQEASPGYKERIRELKEVRKGAAIVEKMAEKVRLICFVTMASVDKYMSIVHAVKMYSRKKPWVVQASCLTVWLVTLILSIPDWLYLTADYDYRRGMEEERICIVTF
ncbi:verrucotoxin subunit beta-like [Engraulis encrasicolus]|uniref:verrucotoxin subunit beta-like n=1 Tax=Engraulis encrasicolus TaxID=184585 RepID=UPI002FD23E01